MLKRKEIESLTTEEKTKSVIDDYNDIAREYAEEFYDDTSDDKYIDKFLQSLSGKKYWMQVVELERIASM